MWREVGIASCWIKRTLFYCISRRAMNGEQSANKSINQDKNVVVSATLDYNTYRTKQKISLPTAR